MTGRFNPNDPALIGLEWPATSTVDEPIDPSRELAHRCRMVTNRTVKNLNFYAPSPNPGATLADFCNWIVATIYEVGDEMAYGTNRKASLNVSGGNTTGALVGGATVADCLNFTTDAAYVRLDPGEVVNIEFSLPFYLLANPRILDVLFRNITATAVAGGTIQAGFRLASGNVIPLGTHSVNAAFLTRENSLSTGEIFLGAYDYVATPSEARRRVWLPTDTTSLNNGTVRFQLSNVGGSIIDVHYVNAEVTYCQENRVATGGLIRASGSTYPWFPGWQTGLEFLNPLTGAVGVTLLAGREYVVTLTQASDRVFTTENTVTQILFRRQDGASRNLRGLVPTDDSPLQCFQYPRLEDGRIGAAAVPVNRGYAFIVIDNVGVSVPELSQPYGDVLTVGGASVLQTVVSTTGGLYAEVRATVRKVGDPADLAVTVQQGAQSRTATLTAAAFDALETDAYGYATVDLPLNAPIMLTAAVNASITAATLAATDHWEVPILSTVDGAFIYTSVTYGGTAQSAVFDGLDIPLLLQMAVPPVTGATLGTGTQTLAPAVTGCPQPASQFVSLDYTSICWGQVPIVSGSPQVTGSPAVTGFCAWEVERSDVDTDWRLIARVHDYNVLCVSDFEARIGVVSDYRVRLCRVDGACGPWAVVTGSAARAGPVTADGGAGCAGLVFTSNEDPDQTVAYPYAFDGDITEGFTFVESETVVFQRLHMRDYQIALRPLERGGVRFSRTMLVNAISVPPALLDEGFRGLRDLAWATLSYVAVLDTRGARWFAAVIVPTGDVRTRGNIYVAAVDVVEVTDRPSVIDVAAV